MATYILIASDAARLTQGSTAAYNVAVERLRRRVWPLYYRTSFAQTIEAGDLCYIYAAGSQIHRQSFIGSAIVDKVIYWSQKDWFEHDKLLTNTPEKIIDFRSINIITDPVSVRPLLSMLDLTGRRDTAWGSFFQGGVKKLNNHDTDILARVVS